MKKNVKFVPKNAYDTSEQKIAREIIRMLQKKVSDNGAPYGAWEDGYLSGTRAAIADIIRVYGINI